MLFDQFWVFFFDNLLYLLFNVEETDTNTSVDTAIIQVVQHHWDALSFLWREKPTPP